MMRLIVVLSIFFLASCNEPTEPDSTKILHDASSDSATPTLEYEIVEKNDTSFADTTRMINRVVIIADSIPSEESIRSIAIAVANAEPKTWKEFTVFLYLPDMDIKLAAYGVAEFKGQNISSLFINNDALYGTKWRSLEKEIQAADDQWAVAKKSPTVSEYSIKLDADKLDDRTLNIIVFTDFPDDTNLLITVDRPYSLQGESESYSGEIFDRDMPVSGGKIQIKVLVDDNPWLRDYKDKQRKLPDLFPDFSKISEDVEISVLFSPARDQPEHIANILGKNAEFVGGEFAKRSGKLTTMRTKQIVNMPVSQ